MTETKEDLRNAFVRAVGSIPPTVRKCQEIFKGSGMTAKEAGDFLQIIPEIFDTLMKTKDASFSGKVGPNTRRKIANLPQKNPQA